MCTILVARQVHPKYPLILAANRDELRSRASSPPVILDEAHDVRGGLDVVGGGSWLAVRAARFVSAVTNHRTHRAADASRASRGGLVVELARRGTWEDAEALLRAITPGHYNEANVLVGDAQRLGVATLRDDAPAQLTPLDGGTTVLTNGEPSAPTDPKIARLLSLAAPAWDQDEDALVGTLHRALSDHERPPREAIAPPPSGSVFTHELLQELQAICVHVPGYGTVSSSILLFGADGALARWDHAEGPPCTTPTRPVSAWARRP